ncbi:MAG: hypothetical protein ACI8S6_002706 [Myxococcota bacterium]|jgi:hypothetical protein
MRVDMVRNFSSLRLALATLLFTLCVSPASAQDGAPAGEDEAPPTPEERGWVPHFRVVGFQDRPGTGNCARDAARYGECIELVDFVPYELIARPLPVWNDKENWRELLSEQVDRSSKRRMRRDRRAVFTRWSAMAELNAQMWEDMVYRWQVDDDAAMSALKGAGYHVFPDAEEQWDLSNPGRSRVYSMPEHKQWIQASEWQQPLYSQLPKFDEEEGDDGSDRDGDGLTDQREQRFGTYPNVKDSDNDGWLDGEEIDRETSPLDPNDYPQIITPGEDPFFRLVRYAVPVTQRHEPPPAAVLQGRFAVRLGVDGRLHEYDLMDADPVPSGPFFEQMFPYENIYRGVSIDDRARFIPLVDFDQPETQLSARQEWTARNSHLKIESFEETLVQSQEQFIDFYRLLTAQIAQFAMEDFTDNHMRILGALTMMRSPPGSKRGTGRLARYLNAATEGETDSASDIAAQLDESAYSVRGGFALSYDKLPETIINAWIEFLAQETAPDRGYFNNLTRVVRLTLNDTLRPSVGTIEKLDDKYLQNWVTENRETGEPTAMRLQIKRLALQFLVDRLSQSKRDRIETSLLIDHVDETIFQGLSEDVLSTPVDVAGLTADSWANVLGSHNYMTSRIPQGLGAIDPIAICTTKLGEEARGQPSVGVVYVDQLFSATDGMKPTDVLWEAKEDLSFLMLDSPVLNTPKVEKLVGLPDGLALYRARWTVWSGWHLFWDVEPFADSLRLVLRTGAICEDMVLAPPELVPSIVRAGLLDGDFRPTEAARIWDDPYRKERRRRRRDRQNPDEEETTDEDVNEARTGRATFDSLYNDYEYAQDTIEEPTETTANTLAQSGLGLFGRDREEQRERRATSIKVPETAQYLKGIVRSPLEEMAGEEKGLIVSVFDSTKPERYYGIRNRRPRTPYARNQRRVYWGHWIRSANWALFFDAEPLSDAVTVVSPSYNPTPSVETDTIVPRWKRNRSWDANFAGGLGMFPFRQVQYLCNSNQTTNYGFTDTCTNEDYTDLMGFTEGNGLFERTEGFGADFSTFATWWAWDEPRLALEMGIELRADFIHPGTSWFYEGSSASLTAVDTDHRWIFRPQGGASFGLRHAPDALPMHRLFRLKPTWGADGPDGSSYQGRIEHGPRAGFLIGPGYNGMEGTLFTEWWVGLNTRRRYSPWSSFTPYHPIATTNYYIRGQYGWTAIPDTDETRDFEMVDSYTILTGFRIQFRLKEPLPDLL